MARLIDADDALARLKKAEKEMNAVTLMGCKAVPMYGVIDFIESRPTVDAVEVVRCKDCKQYNGHRYCTYFAEAVLDNDFCSYGERRTDNG